jgi:hypothetical protein
VIRRIFSFRLLPYIWEIQAFGGFGTAFVFFGLAFDFLGFTLARSCVALKPFGRRASLLGRFRGVENGAILPFASRHLPPLNLTGFANRPLASRQRIVFGVFFVFVVFVFVFVDFDFVGHLGILWLGFFVFSGADFVRLTGRDDFVCVDDFSADGFARFFSGIFFRVDFMASFVKLRRNDGDRYPLTLGQTFKMMFDAFHGFG